MDNNKKIIESILSKLLINNKIHIPSWVKKVKIDVGTSHNAPFSNFWIDNDKEVCVFAFEPNKYNVENFVNSVGKNLNRSFFYLECALSDTILEKQKFYCAQEDSGTSSLFRPINENIKVKEEILVDIMTLESFFDFFPWEQIPYIEHLKIDAQSSDFNIIKGAGKYLSDKIIYIDVETTTYNQYENFENPKNILDYLLSENFECLKWGENATFFNLKFLNMKDKIIYNSLI